MESKLFNNVPIDGRRSGSPMVDPVWSELLNEYQNVMRDYDHLVTNPSALKEKLEHLHDKLREVYRYHIFRKCDASRRSIQNSSSPISTPVIPKKRFWFSFFPKQTI